MLVVLGLVPIVIVIAIVWPIVAIAKQQEAQSGYSYTACVAAWYAQIMAMVGIVVFTMGIGSLFPQDAQRDESKQAEKKLAPHALDLPSKVPDVQAQRQSEQRHMDQNEMRGKKAWQVDVGHRAAHGSQVLRHSCQRAATAVPQKDETLSSNDSDSHRRSSVLPPL